MFTLEMYREWRDSDLTRAMLQTIAETGESTVAQIMNRRTPNMMDDQYLKGFLQGISSVSGWQPKLIDEKTGNEVDAFAEVEE